MFSLITLCNKVFQTYFQSLKKDLRQAGFDPTLIVVSISWVGILIAIGLGIIGKFQLPTDALFYVFWFALTAIFSIRFVLFVSGLVNAQFIAANSFSSLGFVMTAVYSILILGERLQEIQYVAIGITFLGALLFFNFKSGNNIAPLHNKGLILIIVSLILSPLDLIFYKLAIAHTTSYSQFLTGRLVMDAVYYSLFFLVVVRLMQHKSVSHEASKFLASASGLLFMFGSSLSNLLDSWLIYNMSASTFTMLGTISIPAGYFIGSWKYGEKIEMRQIIAGILVVSGILLFVKCSLE